MTNISGLYRMFQLMENIYKKTNSSVSMSLLFGDWLVTESEPRLTQSPRPLVSEPRPGATTNMGYSALMPEIWGGVTRLEMVEHQADQSSLVLR